MTGSSTHSRVQAASTEAPETSRAQSVPIGDQDAPVVLRVTRTGADNTVEEVTAFQLPNGGVSVKVGSDERPRRHESLEAAVRAEDVLRVVDERDTAFSTPVLPSWRLADLLEGDGAEINGTSWVLTEDGSWWPEDVWDDPDHDDDVATATFKVPGAGSMTGGPVSAIRLQRLGDRYWWHDWEREEHDHARASRPQDALEWFAQGLDGKIVDFSSSLLADLDDEAIAGLLPGAGPALWVNGDLWERTQHQWLRRPMLPAGDVATVDLRRAEVCEHVGSQSDAYRWLALTLSPVALDVSWDPSWWWVLVADPQPSAALLAFLGDAVFGSTEEPTPNHPPTVLAHLGDGTRCVGIGTVHTWVAEKLASTIPHCVRFAASLQAVWLLGADGKPTGQAWAYEGAEIAPPVEADIVPLADPTW